jgi:HEAT repeat protein
LVAIALLGLARAGDGFALRFTLEHPAAVARRSPRYRFALLRAFGPKSLPVLHDAVDRGVLDPQLTRAAIEALGSGRYRAAAPSIARRLRDEEPELRVAAARALGQLEASEHTVSVRRALDDPHWAVRAQAAKALGRMHAHHCEEALAAKLSDSAWWVRRHAAYALADLGEPGQLTLANVVRNSTDRYAREMAREALDHDWSRESA